MSSSFAVASGSLLRTAGLLGLRSSFGVKLSDKKAPCAPVFLQPLIQSDIRWPQVPQVTSHSPRCVRDPALRFSLLSAKMRPLFGKSALLSAISQSLHWLI